MQDRRRAKKQSQGSVHLSLTYFGVDRASSPAGGRYKRLTSREIGKLNQVNGIASLWSVELGHTFTIGSRVSSSQRQYEFAFTNVSCEAGA
jgi:hypothetical protein